MNKRTFSLVVAIALVAVIGLALAPPSLAASTHDAAFTVASPMLVADQSLPTTSSVFAALLPVFGFGVLTIGVSKLRRRPKKRHAHDYAGLSTPDDDYLDHAAGADDAFANGKHVLT